MEKTIDKAELIKLLIVFAIEICITLIITFVLPNYGIQLPILAITLILDSLLFIVTLAYTLKKGDTLKAYGFKKIKVSTFFLTVLLTLVATPMYMFANVLSQLVVPNTIVQNLDGLVGDSVGLSFLAVAVIAPIGEEVVMRGFFQNRFKKVMPFAAAAILSGFLFGVLHLNLNQFCYAWVLGVIFAYTNRASGSILTSIIMHMLINASNVGMLLVMQSAMESIGMDFAEVQETARTDGSTMINNVIVFGVLSIASFFLTRLIIRAIAKREGTCQECVTETAVEA